ncbi:MAG TPA: hypothetical protein VNW47_12245 [Terriglobales bacterium]|jgi:hypothetical protein|nr:hypothetical protein [Terriglobales bacterium]
MTAKKIANDHELDDRLVAELRAGAIHAGQRPEEFWDGQRRRIHSRIESDGARRPRNMWLMAATAVLVFVGVLFVAPAGPRPQETKPRATLDADQELLLAVEHALATGTPEALEPLTLLVESSANNNQDESISQKEHGHEN